MASNHTPATALTDVLFADFIWENGYKDLDTLLPKECFLRQAERGDIQISSIMENWISLVNPLLTRSNSDGEDFKEDGSEAKYISTRFKYNRTKYTTKDGVEKVSESKCLNCSLSPSALKNKKGTLRIAISVFNPETKEGKVMLIRIPYPEWTGCLVANGYLIFDFNLDGTFKNIQEERFGKWVCKTVEEFCA